MFEKITAFLPRMRTKHFGEWIIDTENDGTPEHPQQIPWVAYDDKIISFIEAVWHFHEEHPEFELANYKEIAANNNIEWREESVYNACVASLCGQAVMALIFGLIREDRFCEGLLLDFCEDGIVTEWLERLKAIDDDSNAAKGTI